MPEVLEQRVENSLKDLLYMCHGLTLNIFAYGLQDQVPNQDLFWGYCEGLSIKRVEEIIGGRCSPSVLWTFNIDEEFKNVEMEFDYLSSFSQEHKIICWSSLDEDSYACCGI